MVLKRALRTLQIPNSLTVRSLEHVPHRGLTRARRLTVDAEERPVGPRGVIRAIELIPAVQELLIGAGIQQIERVERGFEAPSAEHEVASEPQVENLQIRGFDLPRAAVRIRQPDR